MFRSNLHYYLSTNNHYLVTATAGDHGQHKVYSWVTRPMDLEITKLEQGQVVARCKTSTKKYRGQEV